MTDTKSLGEKWAQYRPTKGTWFWSCAGVCVLTMILGFTVGGWTTGGSAQEMAQDAARDARAELASIVCIEKFVSAPEAAVNLAELKDTSSYQQDDFVEDGGWATMVGMEDMVPGAAALCADKLVAMESLPAREAVSTSEAQG